MSAPKAKRALPITVGQGRCYTMEMSDGENAEITMYGEIVETRPVDWWTNQPVEGDFIVQHEFLDDLEALSGAKAITVRMNSVGGDAGVSILIHNRLREFAKAGAKLICIVDGVAMSGGSLIMCACDTVQVNPSSLIMIHKCWGFLWGGYNADELRAAATSYDAWDKAQVQIYKRKCGLSETVISHMMGETTYMTGQEAVDKNFADELLEDAEPLSIAASADGRCLFVRGRTMHLTPGMFAPDTIPTVKPEASATVSTNKQKPAQAGGQNGGKTMANTLEELRKENPALAEQLMAEARAAASTPAASAPVAPAAAAPTPAPTTTPVAPATQPPEAAPSAAAPTDPVEVERQRIQDIDALASLYDTETIQAAKYGPTACTAQEMVYAAARKAAQQGRSYLGALETDTAASGAQQVGAAAAPTPTSGDGNLTPQQLMAKGRADAKALTKTEKEDK